MNWYVGSLKSTYGCQFAITPTLPKRKYVGTSHKLRFIILLLEYKQYNVMSSIQLSTLAVSLLAAIVFLAMEAAAYKVSSHSSTLPLTQLNAWTLPKPTNKNLFGTFKPSSFSASWYDDHNPTARKVIYNDLDQEELYHFAVSFTSDDWIDQTYDAAYQTSEVKARRPLQLLANKVYTRLKNLRH